MNIIMKINNLLLLNDMFKSYFIKIKLKYSKKFFKYFFNIINLKTKQKINQMIK